MPGEKRTCQFVGETKTLANGLGSALPFVALQLGHDPAVVVSPLMTTLTDMLGTLTFLGLASMIIAIFT